MKRILIYITAAALCIAGCNKEEMKSDEMLFSPGVETKVTASVFDAGDTFGVYVTKNDENGKSVLQVSGNYANNSAVTFDGSTWSTAPKIFWEEGSFNVYGYYPFTSPAPSSIDEYEFTVNTDQRSYEAFESSDFLWGRNLGVTRMDRVPLVFQHKLSKVIINLVKGEDFEGEIPENMDVMIHNLVPAAHVDLQSGDIVKAPKSYAKTINAYKLSTGKYAAIVVPQRIENRVPMFEIVVNGVSYLLEYKFVFKSGTCHTINITLTSDPQKSLINIGGEVGAWN